MISFERPIWQLSAGPGLRSYAELLLTYQVALVGPGDAPGGQGAATTSSTAGRRCGCWPA